MLSLKKKAPGSFLTHNLTLHPVSWKELPIEMELIGPSFMLFAIHFKTL